MTFSRYPEFTPEYTEEFNAIREARKILLSRMSDAAAVFDDLDDTDINLEVKDASETTDSEFDNFLTGKDNDVSEEESDGVAETIDSSKNDVSEESDAPRGLPQPTAASKIKLKMMTPSTD